MKAYWTRDLIIPSSKLAKGQEIENVIILLMTQLQGTFVFYTIIIILIFKNYKSCVHTFNKLFNQSQFDEFASNL